MGSPVVSRCPHIHVVERSSEQLIRNGSPVGTDYVQDPVIGQLAHAIFSGFPPAFYLVVVVTGLILALAANTAFNGFPVLGSILARDGYLPHQLHPRGDRLAFHNRLVGPPSPPARLLLAFSPPVHPPLQPHTRPVPAPRDRAGGRPALSFGRAADQIAAGVFGHGLSGVPG